MSAPQEAGAAQSEAAQIIVTPSEQSEGGEPHDTTEAPGGLNPEMPKEGAQISGAEEPAIFVQPLQAIIPLTDVPKSTETDPAQPSQEGDASQGPEASPTRPSKDVAKTKSKKQKPWPTFVFVSSLTVN